jgi:hypothetical protein
LTDARFIRPLYDHWDPNIRAEVELQDTPLLDDLGKERRIYDSEGVKIGQRDAVFDANEDNCGILLNLETVNELFLPAVPGLDLADAQHQDAVDLDVPHISIYPQAFLRSYGHIQAKSVMTPFNPVINRVQVDIGLARNGFRRSKSSSESETDSNSDAGSDTDSSDDFNLAPGNFQRRPREASADDDNASVSDGASVRFGHFSPLCGISSQVYNELSH